MNVSIVLTVIGEDQPGIVAAISDVLASHSGNWVESSMSKLAGQFAGLLLATLPQENVAACLADLRSLEQRGLSVNARVTAAPAAPEGSTEFELDLVGHDRPGIVRDITRVLRQHAVNVLELETGVESASMAGGDLFRAKARLRAPAGADLDAIQAALEAIATELMVEVTVGR